MSWLERLPEANPALWKYILCTSTAFMVAAVGLLAYYFHQDSVKRRRRREERREQRRRGRHRKR